MNDEIEIPLRQIFFLGSLFRQLRRPPVDNWRSDGAFSLQFLQGVNPMVVRVVTSVEEVREELRELEVTVEGERQTVAGLVGEARLLVADYSALETLPLRPGRVFYAPQVLPWKLLFQLLLLLLCPGAAGQGQPGHPAAAGHPAGLPPLPHTPGHPGQSYLQEALRQDARK